MNEELNRLKRHLQAIQGKRPETLHPQPTPGQIVQFFDQFGSGKPKRRRPRR